MGETLRPRWTQSQRTAHGSRVGWTQMRRAICGANSPPCPAGGIDSRALRGEGPGRSLISGPEGERAALVRPRCGGASEVPGSRLPVIRLGRELFPAKRKEADGPIPGAGPSAQRGPGTGPPRLPV